jgi:hypothetical protein
MKLVVGQLLISNYVDFDGDKTWEYVVVTDVFDNKAILKRKHGGRLIANLNENGEVKKSENNNYLEDLLKNGQPVMAKKTLFGKYKFEAK